MPLLGPMALRPAPGGCKKTSRKRQAPWASLGLTHIVRRVTGSGQGVVAGGFLGKAKIGEFENGVGPFGGVQEILRLERETQTR